MKKVFIIFSNLLLIAAVLQSGKQNVCAQDTRQWGTYIGTGTGYTRAVSSAVYNSTGDVYVVGYALSTTGIGTAGTHKQNHTNSGSPDAFIIKYNSAGVKQWGTYYGGTNEDTPYDIAVDQATGDVYICGRTSSASNTGINTAGCFDGTFAGSSSYDAFLAKFSSAGALLWGTYYGGVGSSPTLSDEGRSVFVDGSSNVYMAGITGSTTAGYFGTPGVQQETKSTGNDGFVVKFSSAGARIWGTYCGGAGNERGRGVAVNSSGEVYFSGWTNTTSTNIYTTGAWRETVVGSGDAFLVKYNSSGVRLWGTYYGGTVSGYEECHDIAIDGTGNVYISGVTSSTTGIGTQGQSSGFQTTPGGGTYDDYLAKFSSAGDLLWDTYYGGDDFELFSFCTTDASNNVFLAGHTSSSSGISSSGFQDTFGGGDDAFLVKFNSSGARIAATYYGGTGAEASQHGSGVSVDASGGVYLPGHTTTTTANVIASSGADQVNMGSATEAGFLVKFSSASGGCIDAAITSATAGNNPICAAATTNLTANGVAGTNAVLHWWTGSGGTGTDLGTANPLTGQNPGTYYARVTGDCGLPVEASVTVSAIPGPNAPVATAGSGITTTQFTVHWNAVSGAIEYFLDVSTDNSFGSFVSGYSNLNVGNVLSKSVTGLTGGTTYYYRVRVSDGGACTSNHSNTISVTTACPDMIGGTLTPPNHAIICTNTTQALSTSGSGGTLQWQYSTNNTSWNNVSGETNSSYNTPNGATTPFTGAGSTVYYRCMVKSSGCYDVASATTEVTVSNPSITVTVDSKTDNSITLDWSPVGGGNYDIDYDGTSSGSGSSVTPPYTISGLTASGTYNITVTQTGLSCSASGTLTGVKTLCAVPTGVTLSSPANKQLKVDWNGDAGDYRVYYRALSIQNAYSFKDVATLNNNGTITITVPYDGTTYEVYVVRRNCPNPGDLGQKSALYNGIVKPLSACAPEAVINNVISTCSGQIEVSMSNSPTGNYVVYIQRLTPTVAGAVKYNVSGGTFQIHVGQPGQTFAVGVASKCVSGTGNIVMWPGGITIKPLCNPIGNLVLSHATCNGFTASWNREICSENQVSTYQFFMKKTGTLTWNSYPVNSPIAPISPFLKVKWLGKGYEMNCYVKANYICNGYVIGGPSSTVQTITTLSAGCREEGEEMLTPETPSTQIIAADNSEAISIYPNPNNGQFQLDISRMSNDQQQVMIEVMNVLGQTILTRISEVKDGHGNEIITLPETAAAGTYFVRVTVGSNVYTAMVNVSK